MDSPERPVIPRAVFLARGIPPTLALSRRGIPQSPRRLRNDDRQLSCAQSSHRFHSRVRKARVAAFATFRRIGGIPAGAIHKNLWGVGSTYEAPSTPNSIPPFGPSRDSAGNRDAASAAAATRRTSQAACDSENANRAESGPAVRTATAAGELAGLRGAVS